MTCTVMRPQYYTGMKTKEKQKEKLFRRDICKSWNLGKQFSVIFQRQVYMPLSDNSDFIDKREASNLTLSGYTKLFIWYNKRNCY